MSRRGFRRILAEPLLHFALIGAALFGAYFLVGGDRGVSSDRIVIDDAIVGDLVLQYSRTWQRPPTRAEMKAMLDNYVREEVLYRQGVAMGLEDGDDAIKRRVLQKLEVIAEESGQGEPPSDLELERFLKEHAARYASPPVLTFEQVYFDPARHGAKIGQVVAGALGALRAGTAPATPGDPSLLPRTITDEPADVLARDFGEEFPAALAMHKPGEWFGPVRSGVGLHLVRIVRRIDGKTPRLADVRATVLRDWEADRRRRAAQDYYDGVKRDYSIVVSASDLPDDVMPTGARR